MIANKIALSDSGVGGSWDCNRVDCVLFDILSGRIVPGLIQFGRDEKQQCMKHLEEKYKEMGEIEVNIEEMILKFIQSAPKDRETWRKHWNGGRSWKLISNKYVAWLD